MIGKRPFSIAMSIVLALGLCPLPAFASNETELAAADVDVIDQTDGEGEPGGEQDAPKTFSEAVDDLKAKGAALDEAEAKKISTAEASAEANAALEKAQADKTAADAALEKAQSDNAAAVEVQTAAQEAATAAASDLQVATSEMDKANAGEDAAKLIVDSTVVVLEKAKDADKKATSEKEEADASLESAAKTLEETAAALEEAKAQDAGVEEAQSAYDEAKLAYDQADSIAKEKAAAAETAAQELAKAQDDADRAARDLVIAKGVVYRAKEALSTATDANDKAVAALDKATTDAEKAASILEAADEAATKAETDLGTATIVADAAKEEMMSAESAVVEAFRALREATVATRAMYEELAPKEQKAAAEARKAIEAAEDRVGIAHPKKVDRLYGDVALDTMNAIVDAGSFPHNGTVVLATFGGYHDALTAAGVAGLAGAPVLMTDGTSLSPQTKAQLELLTPTKIIVCGGTSAISDYVVIQAINAAGNASYERFWGNTATGTAVDIFLKGEAATGGEWAQYGFVCTNEGYWDALASAPISYARHMPIFLTEGSEYISQETLDAMKGRVSGVYIVGGERAISDNVITQIKDAGIAYNGRAWGQTAVETSEKVAELGLTARGITVDGLGVATMNDYYDALSGAAFCGNNGSVLVLVKDESSHSISGFIKSHAADINQAYIFGGRMAVSEATENAIVAALG